MKKNYRHYINSVAIISALYLGVFFPRLFDMLNLATFLTFGTVDRNAKRQAFVGFQEGLTLWSVCGTATTSIVWTSRSWLLWIRVAVTAGQTILLCDNKYKSIYFI